MKLYEHLGVRQFQKLVFGLEKVIHFKDKGKNINYHIKKSNIDELDNFKKFLYYNGTIHVRNALVVALLIIIQPFLFSSATLFYLIPSLIKNLYCVMLQRYNYLRINKVIEIKTQRIEKKVHQKIDSFTEAFDKQDIVIKDKEECLSQIDNIRKFLQGESDAFLDDKSIETLQLIKKFLSNNYETNHEIEQMISEPFVKKIGGI